MNSKKGDTHMSDYIKVAAIIGIFLLASASESEANEQYYEDDIYGNQRVTIVEREERSGWAKTGDIALQLLILRAQQPRQQYNMGHTQRQVIQHGAGGCTPNFSTGGCL